MAEMNPECSPISALIPDKEDWRLKNNDTDFDKWIRCGICHGKLKDPRTLTCLHTFCLECIEYDYNKQRRAYDGMVCPTLPEEFLKHQGCFLCVICQYPLYMPCNNARSLPSNYNFLKVSYNARAEWVDQFPSSAYVGSPMKGEIKRLSNASEVVSSVSPEGRYIGYQEATHIPAQRTPISRCSSNADNTVTEAKEDTPLMQSSRSGYGGLSPRPAETIPEAEVQDKDVTSTLPCYKEPGRTSSSTEHEKQLSVQAVKGSDLPREAKSPNSGETDLPTKSAMDGRNELAKQREENRKLDLVEALKTSLPASPVMSEKSISVEETVTSIEPNLSETDNEGGCAVIGASSHSPGQDEMLIKGTELEAGSKSPHNTESRDENVSGRLSTKEDDSTRSPHTPILIIEETASAGTSAEKYVPSSTVDDSLGDSCATKSSLGPDQSDAASGAEGSPSHCKETGASPQRHEPRSFMERSPGSEASEASDGSLDCMTRGARLTAKAVRDMSCKEAVDITETACTTDSVSEPIVGTPKSSRTEITSSSEENFSLACEKSEHDDFTHSNKEIDSLSGSDDKETETSIPEDKVSISSKDYESFSSDQTDTSSSQEAATFFSNKTIEGSPFNQSKAPDTGLGVSTNLEDSKFSGHETDHCLNKEYETPVTKETGKSPIREIELSSSSDETGTSSVTSSTEDGTSSSSTDTETSPARLTEKSPTKETEQSSGTETEQSALTEAKPATTNDAVASPGKETEQFSKESGALRKQTVDEVCHSPNRENTPATKAYGSDPEASVSNLCQISRIKETNSALEQHKGAERPNTEPYCDKPANAANKEDGDKVPERTDSLGVMPDRNGSASSKTAANETSSSSNTDKLPMIGPEHSSASPSRQVQKLEIPPTKLPKASRWPAASSLDRLQQHYDYVREEGEHLGVQLPRYGEESRAKKAAEQQGLKKALLFMDMKYEFKDPALLFVTSLAVNRRTGNFVVIDNSLNLAIMYQKMPDDITYECIGLHHFRESIVDCEFLNDDREQVLVMARTVRSIMSDGGILMYRIPFAANTRPIHEKIPFYSNPSLRDAGGFVTTTGPDRFLFTLPDSNCIGETVGPSAVDVKRNCGTFKLPSHVARFQWSDENYYAIADTGNHQVVILDSGFKRCYVIGKFGSEDGEFFYPHGLTVDDDKMLYVCDSNNYRVQQFRLKATRADFKGCPVRYTYQLKSVTRDLKPIDCGITRSQQLLLVLFRNFGHGVLQLYHLQETEDSPEIVLKSFRANEMSMESRLLRDSVVRPVQEEEGSCWRCCLLPCCACACRRKRNARDRRAYEQLP